MSSRVHNQLLQIADERASAAEQKALQLEREVGMNDVYCRMYNVHVLVDTLICMNNHIYTHACTLYIVHYM